MMLVILRRFLGRSARGSGGAGVPEPTVQLIQEGDEELRNQFITDYQPYVAKVTSRFCKRYIDPASDDEFAIGLSAFNEAITQYSSRSGRPFLSFAETVIRRRLIDFMRKEERFARQTPYSAFELEVEEEGVLNPVEIHQALKEYELQEDTEERRSEIMELERVLTEFGINFPDLVEASPKHADSRRVMVQIGIMLASDSRLMRLLLDKRMMPVKELLAVAKVSRKTLERNRKYIIAIALIYNGPYPFLREYIRILKEDRDGGS